MSEALAALDQNVGEHNASVEVILVDGGSQDASIERAKNFRTRYLDRVSVLMSERGRARQMNAGAEAARGAIIVFLHIDTRLPKRAFMALDALPAEAHWGRFDVRLNNSALAYRVISWFINQRSRLTGIATGDQAIFVRKDIFEQIGAYPDQTLMEDVELSRRLKRVQKPVCIRQTVSTSARKWEQGGIVRTVWLMWKLRARYFLGAAPEELHRQYYRNV